MRVLLILLLQFVFIYPAYAQESGPGLLVTPTRAVMEGKTRSVAISLANNGNQPGTYMLSLVNKRMKEDGSLEDIKDHKDAKEGELFADDLLRISPRRVELNPGEHQRIRILARKPKDLADGEYRSHLYVLLSPPSNDDTGPSEADKKLSIKIQANFGVTIPVILRQGELVESGSISDIKLFDKEGQKQVSFYINRSGTKSVYGDLRVNYKKAGGGEYVLKNLGGLAVYTPNERRLVSMALDIPDGLKIDKGTIEVTYTKKEDDGGGLIAANKIEL